MGKFIKIKKKGKEEGEKEGKKEERDRERGEGRRKKGQRKKKIDALAEFFQYSLCISQNSTREAEPVGEREKQRDRHRDRDNSIKECGKVSIPLFYPCYWPPNHSADLLLGRALLTMHIGAHIQSSTGYRNLEI